ncbi:MAG: ABC transporter permease subunit [Acidobacteria bacterium]|nr:MAG: ABC transporter permease subunit [Acidobacteriota bacterium]
MNDADGAIRRLYRQRPRSRFLRLSAALLLALVAYAWLGGDFGAGGMLSPRRLANVERFLGEIRPFPLQGRDFEPAIFVRWLGEVMAEKGWHAARVTLELAVAAIVLAAVGGLLLSLPAARSWATPEPYLPSPRPPGRWRRASWRAVVASARSLQILLRAIPEYVWAFLFLALIGPTAWPIVLALALHNAGILGKLGAEVVENLEPQPLRALRALGADRRQIAAAGIFPQVLPRFLLFFFYRWETCVREATVLGMLGIPSLGFWILDARARQLYDEMLVLVLLGALLVIAGDVVSAVARGVVRRAA